MKIGGIFAADFGLFYSVTQDGAKPESVKGYDEAVRQIDDKIAANKAKIAELEKELAEFLKYSDTQLLQ